MCLDFLVRVPPSFPPFLSHYNNSYYHVLPSSRANSSRPPLFFLARLFTMHSWMMYVLLLPPIVMDFSYSCCFIIIEFHCLTCFLAPTCGSSITLLIHHGRREHIYYQTNFVSQFCCSAGRLHIIRAPSIWTRKNPVCPCKLRIITAEVCKWKSKFPVMAGNHVKTIAHVLYHLYVCFPQMFACPRYHRVKATRLVVLPQFRQYCRCKATAIRLLLRVQRQWCQATRETQKQVRGVWRV